MLLLYTFLCEVQTMNAQFQSRTKPQEAQVLASAFLNAGKELGLSQSVLVEIIDRDRSSISRSGINPNTNSGKLALMLIRIYRSLFVLMGGDSVQMKHWMQTPNLHTGGIPAEQVSRSIEGLVKIVGYLDAMRGKVTNVFISCLKRGYN
jgi:hypothetical protein